MDGAGLVAGPKLTSVLRRIPSLGSTEPYQAPGLEGDVCAFELARDASPIEVEAVSGRYMMVAPGDVFLGTPGHRESTRWTVGSIPAGGLIPGNSYWVLAPSGLVGELIADSPLEKRHLEQVIYRGVLRGEGGATLNIRHFATKPALAKNDQGVPVHVVLGTSSEVGKTTAALAVLQALRAKGNTRLVALKATGTASVCELAVYLDFGAAQAFDCVDFGFPTTYPSRRKDLDRMFERMVATCLSIPADAVVVECGGDMLGANVPAFLKRLKRSRPDATIILVAADALAALGGKQMLNKMGLPVHLITGPCTDTPTLQQRTQELCGIRVMNLAHGSKAVTLT
jgi:hypothetical protein